MPDNNFEQNQQQFPQEQQQPQAQAPYTPPVQNQPVQQPYTNSQPQQGYYPQQPYAPVQPVEEKASIGLAILSFFIPIVGIILFFAKKKTKPKTAKACGIAALISIVLCIVISFATGGDDNTSTNNNSSSYSADVSDDETTTAANSSQADEKNVLNVGDVFESNSLRITYVSCDADCKGYDSYWGPDSGNKIVRAEFTFENIGNSDEILNSLDCYADDSSCEAFYGADDYKSPTLESISQGRKLNAVVYYEVPEDANEIVLEYETNYWSSNYIKFEIK